MGLKSAVRPWLYPLSPAPAILLLFGCSHGATHPESKGETEVARDHILKLEEKVADLETRLTALNEKILLESSARPGTPPPPATAPVPALPTEAISAPAVESRAIPKPKASMAPSFSSNESIDRFREAKILFDSKRYPDAILEFSDFVKNEPDHALAPAAQYYLGMSYFQQREFKLAEEELNRGMLAYPHSSHIPDTLLALMKVSGELKNAANVTYYREKLLSGFPNSPQAAGIPAPVAPEPAKETE